MKIRLAFLATTIVTTVALTPIVSYAGPFSFAWGKIAHHESNQMFGQVPSCLGGKQMSRDFGGGVAKFWTWGGFFTSCVLIRIEPILRGKLDGGR